MAFAERRYAGQKKPGQTKGSKFTDDGEEIESENNWSALDRYFESRPCSDQSAKLAERARVDWQLRYRSN